MRQRVGAVAQTAVGVRDQLRGHVLELQRGDRATELLDQAAVGRGSARAVGIGLVLVHQRGDLFVRRAEARHQRVAGVFEQGVETVEVVAGRHQVILQLGSQQQGPDLRADLMCGVVHQRCAP